MRDVDVRVALRPIPGGAKKLSGFVQHLAETVLQVLYDCPRRRGVYIRVRMPVFEVMLMAQQAKQMLENGGAVLERAIRTVVVDDMDCILETVCALLEYDSRIEVVGRAKNGVEALDAVASLKPDLVIMDVNMPVMGGIQCAGLLSQHFPKLRIVLMSAIDSPKVREQCRNTGANAFACKVNFREEFILAMRAMFEDQESFCTA